MDLANKQEKTSTKKMLENKSAMCNIFSKIALISCLIPIWVLLGFDSQRPILPLFIILLVIGMIYLAIHIFTDIKFQNGSIRAYTLTFVCYVWIICFLYI
jgi:hypothetical protein